MTKTISTKKAKNILESQNLFKCDLTNSKGIELLPYANSKNNAENAVLSAIMDYLARCSLVASSWRNNVGAVKRENRFVRFGKEGQSDIIGFLTDGRFLAIEAKRGSGGKLTQKQLEFLQCVDAAGGVAIIASDVVDVINRLERERKAKYEQC